jgi:hypothetical protein
MLHFEGNEEALEFYAEEIKKKYKLWKATKDNGLLDRHDPNWNWVELEPKNTICIKINEEMIDVIFPPFAGSFDAIFDIEAFKQLRKDKEELGNYMMLSMELPMRKDTENNNDFMIDLDTMRYFHNLATDTVPENVGVITSPMPITPIKFDKDTVDRDGVAKAERDFWSGSGITLFNPEGKSTSQGLALGIKTDEEIVFGALVQIERWINRYLELNYKNNLLFNVEILHTTDYNRKEMFDMFMAGGTLGAPMKSHMIAVAGLQPIEVMNMAYLENDLLKMHEEFIPYMSSHTMGADANAPAGKSTDETKSKGKTGAQAEGRPKKDAKDLSDEGARAQDKPNA